MDRTRTKVDQFGNKGRPCAEEGEWTYWTKDVEDGADPRECLEYSEGGHEDSWYNIRGRKKGTE